MTAGQLSYSDEQYQQALAIVEACENKRETLSVYVKLHGNALALVLAEKDKTPKRSKARIINRLLNELHESRQKKK